MRIVIQIFFIFVQPFKLTMKEILLFLNYAEEYDRRLFFGLSKFAKQNTDWVFRNGYPALQEDHSSLQDLSIYGNRKVDAIVGRIPEALIPQLKSLGIPVVLSNLKKSDPEISRLTCDYDQEGKMAADFFISKKYSNLAFLGIQGSNFSTGRFNGFKKEAEERVPDGNFFSYFQSSAPDASDPESITAWVKTLPERTGLFACCDVLAATACTACFFNKFSVPEHISILGIDNDEFICTTSYPQISSIARSVEKAGYSLGKKLQKLFEGDSEWPFEIKVKPLFIEERQSTDKTKCDDPLIDTVLTYVHENYNKKLTLEQLAKMINMCKRNLEIRFKKEMPHTSLKAYIIDYRIKNAIYLLTKTSKPIGNIAIEVGFTDASNFSQTFKRNQGITPHEYRSLYKKD